MDLIINKHLFVDDAKFLINKHSFVDYAYALQNSSKLVLLSFIRRIPHS